MTPNASKQGKLDSFAAIFWFIFLPCMWGLGFSKIGDRYDWTTGVPDIGNDWRKVRVIPRPHPLSPSFVLCLVGVETERFLDYQRRAGISSIVRWNLRPVIFGVEKRVPIVQEWPEHGWRTSSGQNGPFWSILVSLMLKSSSE